MAFEKGALHPGSSRRTGTRFLSCIVMLAFLITAAGATGLWGCRALREGAGCGRTAREAPAHEIRGKCGREGRGIGDASGMARGNNLFGFDLYGRLRTRKGNLFFSPYSIRSSLVLVHAGAGGPTREQTASVLHIAQGGRDFDESFALFRQRIHAAGKAGSAALKTVDSLWVQKGFGLKGEFLNLSRRIFEAPVFEVDYEAGSERTRNEINAWVAKNTGEKIEGLLGQGAVQPDTALVIADAVYFSGRWADRFDEQESRQGVFRLGGGKTGPAVMMHRRGMIRTVLVPDMRLIELPYAGGALSMIILLPRNIDGLQGIEDQFDEQRFNTWMKELSRAGPADVSLTLPRFSMTCRADLGPLLKVMGMENAFSAAADFSGMASHAGLFIGAVAHKAGVEVHERGTEAASATGTIMTKGVRDPVRVKADHPFMFLIREISTGAVLFMGRFADPGT